MSIKSLLNKGDVNEGYLEKVADALLAAPRGMWLGKSVKVINNQVEHNTSSQNFHNKIWNNFGQLRGNMKPLFGLFIAIFYSLSSIVLAVPLLVGLTLKKIAVSTDAKAKQFQEVVDKRLNLDKQLKVQNQLNQNKSRIDDRIQYLEKNLSSLPKDNPLIAGKIRSGKLHLEWLKKTQNNHIRLLNEVDTKVTTLQQNYQKAKDNYLS